MILFSDGCGEYYDTAHISDVWTDVEGSPAVNGSGGRNGGAGIEFSTFEGLTRSFPVQTGSVFCGFAMKLASLNEDFILTVFRDATAQLTLAMLASGAIRLVHGATSQDTATGILLADVFHYIELQFLVANSGGLFELKVDGVSVLSGSGLDTQTGANAGIDAIFFGSTGSHVLYTLDDVYILETTGGSPQDTFLGDIRIDAVVPDGDGAQTEFTTTFPASPTTHYTKVDEIPATADTDYNESGTNGHRDLFDYAALPAVAGGSTVIGLKVVAFVKKLDAGARNIRMVARPIATNQNGSDIPVQVAYGYKEEYFDDNPEVSAVWTDATINASEFGVEVRP